MMKLIHFAFIYISFLVSLSLQAQEDKGRVSLRIASVIDLPQSTYYLLAADGSSEEVEISSRRLSRKISLQPSMKYYLSTQIPDKDKGENAKSYGVCIFHPSNKYKEAIGILLKKDGGAKKNALKLYQINGDRSNFKPGDRKVFNLSKFPIQIKFAGKKTQIAPRGVESIKAPASQEGQFLPVYGVFSKKQNKWRRFLSSRWVADPNVRSILFVYPQAATQSLTFHGIDDSM